MWEEKLFEENSSINTTLMNKQFFFFFFFLHLFILSKHFNVIRVMVGMELSIQGVCTIHHLGDASPLQCNTYGIFNYKYV